MPKSSMRMVLLLLYMVLLVGKIAECQMCFRAFKPANAYNRYNGYCGYAIGGSRREIGVFVRSMSSCCRRPQANGWGLGHSCTSCMRVRGWPSAWSQWSTCTRSCGWGTQTRRRSCSTSVCAGMRGRNAFETRRCIWSACCSVDGGWSSWSESTGCTVSCGLGMEFRQRTCSNPPPSCGGSPCEGSKRQYKECNGGGCAQWGSWMEQGPCSASCGEGTILRLRECHRPAGDVCLGEPRDTLPCNLGPCAVKRSWCAWMGWGSCSATRKGSFGVRKRVRVCECESNATPLRTADAVNATSLCEGNPEETSNCTSVDARPVNGSWGQWSEWGRCTALVCLVNKGIQVRTRKCENPAPAGTSLDCVGEEYEKRSCLNMDNCFVRGVLDVWSRWSPCSKTCGSCGVATRERSCISPFDDPTNWGVDVVLGKVKLLCRVPRQKESRECQLPSCVEQDNCTNIDQILESHTVQHSNDVQETTSNRRIFTFITSRFPRHLFTSTTAFSSNFSTVSTTRSFPTQPTFSKTHSTANPPTLSSTIPSAKNIATSVADQTTTLHTTLSVEDLPASTTIPVGGIPTISTTSVENNPTLSTTASIEDLPNSSAILLVQNFPTLSRTLPVEDIPTLSTISVEGNRTLSTTASIEGKSSLHPTSLIAESSTLSSGMAHSVTNSSTLSATASVEDPPSLSMHPITLKSINKFEFLTTNTDGISPQTLEKSHESLAVTNAQPSPQEAFQPLNTRPYTEEASLPMNKVGINAEKVDAASRENRHLTSVNGVTNYDVGSSRKHKTASPKNITSGIAVSIATHPTYISSASSTLLESSSNDMSTYDKLKVHSSTSSSLLFHATSSSDFASTASDKPLESMVEDITAVIFNSRTNDSKQSENSAMFVNENVPNLMQDDQQTTKSRVDNQNKPVQARTDVLPRQAIHSYESTGDSHSSNVSEAISRPDITSTLQTSTLHPSFSQLNLTPSAITATEDVKIKDFFLTDNINDLPVFMGPEPSLSSSSQDELKDHNPFASSQLHHLEDTPATPIRDSLSASTANRSNFVYVTRLSVSTFRIDSSTVNHFRLVNSSNTRHVPSASAWWIVPDSSSLIHEHLNDLVKEETKYLIHEERVSFQQHGVNTGKMIYSSARCKDAFHHNETRNWEKMIQSLALCDFTSQEESDTRDQRLPSSNSSIIRDSMPSSSNTNLVSVVDGLSSIKDQDHGQKYVISHPELAKKNVAHQRANVNQTMQDLDFLAHESHVIMDESSGFYKTSRNDILQVEEELPDDAKFDKDEAFLSIADKGDGLLLDSLKTGTNNEASSEQYAKISNQTTDIKNVIHIGSSSNASEVSAEEINFPQIRSHLVGKSEGVDVEFSGNSDKDEEDHYEGKNLYHETDYFDGENHYEEEDYFDEKNGSDERDYSEDEDHSDEEDHQEIMELLNQLESEHSDTSNGFQLIPTNTKEMKPSEHDEDEEYAFGDEDYPTPEYYKEDVESEEGSKHGYNDNSDNCMELPVAEMTQKMWRCCNILDKNNASNPDNATIYQDCLNLQMRALYKVEADFDAEAPIARSGSKCFCRRKKKLMKSLCCFRSFCHQWPNPLFRSLCKVCQPFCKPCFRSLLSG